MSRHAAAIRSLGRSASFKAVTSIIPLSSERGPMSTMLPNPRDDSERSEAGDIALETTGIQDLLAKCFNGIQQDLATSHEVIMEAVKRQLGNERHYVHQTKDTSSAQRSEADGSCEVVPVPEVLPVQDAQPHHRDVPEEAERSPKTMDCSASEDDDRGLDVRLPDAHSENCAEPALVGVVPMSENVAKVTTIGRAADKAAGRYTNMPAKSRSVVRTSIISARGPFSESGSVLFEVLPVWKRKKQSVASHLGSWISSVSQRSFRHVEDEEDLVDSCVIHPYHPARSFWDLASLFLVVYDMVMIPLSLFDLPETPFLEFMTWCTRLFWTADIPLTFFSGYVSSTGHIELQRSVIASRYLKTWLAADAIIVGMDWLELLISAILANIASVTRLGKASRIFRIIRMIRLLRIARMGDIINVLLEQFSSVRVRVLTHIIKLCTTMLAAGHFLACMWYGCGTINEDVNWLKEYEYEGAPFWDRYIMSYRWAIAQFGGGMDEVHPRSLEEQFYGLLAFISAFWSGAVFISMLTSSMTQLCIDGSQQNVQLNVLRQYLEQNKISKNLALRLKRNAHHALLERRKIIPEDCVELVSYISEPLRVELRFEIYSPPLKAHPFFMSYIRECPNVMKKVCHSAMSMCLVSAGDTVFFAGESPANPVLYFVNRGVMQYTAANSATLLVSEGSWLCEASLWTTWTHCGNLSALQDCRLYKLDTREFQAISIQFEHGDFHPVKYADKFVEALNAADPGDVTDMFAPQEAMAMGVVEARSSSSRDAARDDGQGSMRLGPAASTFLA